MRILLAIIFMSFSSLAMEKKINPGDVLRSRDKNSPIGMDLKKAFKYAVQDFDASYAKVFQPCQQALINYQELKNNQYQSIKKFICENNLSCEDIWCCHFSHCILAAYHSTEEKDIVDLILTEGFKPSDSSRSMGSGVYFTTAMKNGDNNNNPYAIAKSRGYGKYTIIGIVMIHDGIKKINSSASLFSEDAQNWSSNIDLKYMPPGVKVYDKNNVEYGGENVIKDPEKIIPLGYVYKKDLSDDDSD